MSGNCENLSKKIMALSIGLVRRENQNTWLKSQGFRDQNRGWVKLQGPFLQFTLINTSEFLHTILDWGKMNSVVSLEAGQEFKNSVEEGGNKFPGKSSLSCIGYHEYFSPEVSPLFGGITIHL